MIQHQKHKQARYYNKSAKDLPSLKTEDAVYIQLVPNIRRWTPMTIVEALSARSYRLKTPRGGIYVTNRKFIRIKHTDSRQSLKTTQKDTLPDKNTTHTNRPMRIIRKPQSLINELYLGKEYTEKICIIYKDFISSLSFSLFTILCLTTLQAFCQ